MPSTLALDLKILHTRAFDRAEWAEAAIRRYHVILAPVNAADAKPLRAIYQCMFVPTTFWPFNIQDVLEDCLTVLEKGKHLSSAHGLIIEMLPEPPDKAICAAVTGHEFQVQKGTYENLVKTQAKYDQNELAIRNDPDCGIPSRSQARSAIESGRLTWTEGIGGIFWEGTMLPKVSRKSWAALHAWAAHPPRP